MVKPCFFMCRCSPPSEEPDTITRSGVLREQALLTLTETERLMLDRGYKTRGMVFRENFWTRLAYHGYREFGGTGCLFQPAIEEIRGDFVITCRDAADRPVFRTTIARSRVKRFLTTFEKHLADAGGLTIRPIPLDLIFDVRMTADLDLKIRPQLRLIQKNGEYRLLDGIDLDRFQYGDLVYIPELKVLADMQEMETVPAEWKRDAATVIRRARIPAFIEKYAAELESGRFRPAPDVRGLRILRNYDHVEIIPEAIDRDWCRLSVQYGFGNSRISLAEILQARKAGQRYIGTADGWVDCHATDLDGFGALDDPVSEKTPSDNRTGIRLSKIDLLRIHAVSAAPVNITGPSDHVRWIKKLLAGQSVSPLPAITGMTAELRTYQQRGTEWLWFLQENGFGGLLCDDMGLGKTHQVMALMRCLRHGQTGGNPFLVVCPTTVLSHWENKLREYASALTPVVYHGADRNLPAALSGCDVLLTSYGILFRDIHRLRQVDFTLAVFDEIQHIKNPRTKAYDAARQINAPVKLGLTGTPIENSLADLKALMDLTVPGYLQSDEVFKKRYMDEIEPNLKSPRRDELGRLIAPFTLRRLKSTVLHELPEKIEDIRTCRLSDDQVRLYRNAVDSRKKGVLEALRNPDTPVPYIHIFALLTLLKQICDHPALVDGNVENYSDYASGKWELFKEILAETIGSGLKVVIYSQFLGMIDIISDYLEKTGVSHVVLTGKSRKRGEIISRFNTDPHCRVFVGSLRAGGVGIDLVAASVVIHYDRWWNAAREDQATDRVHRIGQKRGVQVFKLVTEGTLEEKIAAIIARKKNLMNSVVREDDPDLLKTFTREQLMEMLALPSQHPAAGEIRKVAIN